MGVLKCLPDMKKPAEAGRASSRFVNRFVAAEPYCEAAGAGAGALAEGV